MKKELSLVLFHFLGKIRKEIKQVTLPVIIQA
jgi:hypothetical protein